MTYHISNANVSRRKPLASVSYSTKSNEFRENDQYSDNIVKNEDGSFDSKSYSLSNSPIDNESAVSDRPHDSGILLLKSSPSQLDLLKSDDDLIFENKNYDQEQEQHKFHNEECNATDVSNPQQLQQQKVDDTCEEQEQKQEEHQFPTSSVEECNPTEEINNQQFQNQNVDNTWKEKEQDQEQEQHQYHNEECNPTDVSNNEQFQQQNVDCTWEEQEQDQEQEQHQLHNYYVEECNAPEESNYPQLEQQQNLDYKCDEETHHCHELDEKMTQSYDETSITTRESDTFVYEFFTRNFFSKDLAIKKQSAKRRRKRRTSPTSSTINSYSSIRQAQ